MIGIRTKATVATIAAMLVALVAGGLVLRAFWTIRQPLDETLPLSVKRLALDSRLEALSGQIRLYDEVLTQSARNYAFTQDKKWRERYLTSEPLLDSDIKEAETRGDKEDAALFAEVDAANQALVLMEHNSIAAVDEGRPADARAILESGEYWRQKGLYSGALSRYSERRHAKAKESGATATDLLARVLKDTRAAAATGELWALLAVVVGLIATASVCYLAARLGTLGEQLRRLSLEDPLTGLRNRRGFLTLGEQLIKVARRQKQGLHVVFADFDRLKVINDAQGHHEGDRALVEAAEVLRRTFRESDLIGRVGGDEFAVIAMTAGDESGPRLTDRLRRNVEARNEMGDLPFRLSMGIGSVAYDPAAPRPLEALLDEADARMYEQKHGKAGRR